MTRTAYMDYNATTPIYPSVVDAMCDALRHVGNPSSVHRVGREARAMMENAREAVASLINVPNDWVVFTSGGTEADALAIEGAGRKRVLVSSVEHAAVLNVRDDIETIPVDSNGIINLAALGEALKSDDAPALVSVMAANNETGVVQPIKEIVELAHNYGALMHCDAVQMIGKMDFDMHALGCDLVSLSAHKFGGPKGVGALVKREGLTLDATHRGGGQERSLRGGTENLAGIIGFGAATKEKIDFIRIQALRDDLEKQIKELGGIIVAESVERLPNTTCVSLSGLTSERQVMALDLSGVMVSAGSACSSGTVKASHVLKAMGLDEEIADCAIRVSLGWSSSKEDIDMFVQAYSKLVERVQVKKSSRYDAA